jgi:excisionase family DNA binding protein
MEQQLAYSVDEACHLIGIARSKFYELVRGKHITALKVGRSTIITADELKR